MWWVDDRRLGDGTIDSRLVDLDGLIMIDNDMWIDRYKTTWWEHRQRAKRALHDISKPKHLGNLFIHSLLLRNARVWYGGQITIRLSDLVFVKLCPKPSDR